MEPFARFNGSREMMGKILVVDDEEEIRRIGREILEREGYRVSVAKTTDDAWKKVQKENPDLLLLDIMIPGDLKKFVKKLEEKGSKILYLSVVDRTEAKRRGLLDISENIKGYIEKPFSLDTLLGAVEEALNEEE